MSEYKNVEKPFLEQLSNLGWTIIDQGPAFPTDPSMYEAFIQLRRYTDQREETKKSGLKEGEPKLFYTNQFMIRTCGDMANFGTITASEETWYSPWKDITPETYKQYTLPLGKERQQEILIQGMLPKETLLDIIRNCTIFIDIGKTRAKIVCRYQQYRATCKIIERLQKGKTPAERSGVIWATQGSGKSLTMVFVIRKLRTLDDIKNYKVCLVNDRKDLEDQLGKTANLTGEKVFYITSTNQLRDKLASDVSNLNMVMIHKFQENQGKEIPDYLESALEHIPKFETFGIVNSSERILLMLDEAHRTQSGDFGDNLFEAFPNATRLAFTGTPLIRVKDKKKTVDRFGEYIDKYKLQDAVDDGATIQILYFKNFMQSLDIILPKSSAIPYKIPVKRFGYILIKVKERYKDETLTISGSGEKVKKLINDHLISLGINPKIPPVELLSDRFIAEVEKKKTHKAKASEMEHAIRKHCKIHLNKDPAFYSKLSEKLERLIQQYKDTKIPK
ncbi:restriction endonuclease subunit R [Candidatus Magnetomorum sp. HK-1]|nr:restriction endonuclease subunit R [Candidatus Magnetomorum sp. HK-1]